MHTDFLGTRIETDLADAHGFFGGHGLRRIWRMRTDFLGTRIETDLTDAHGYFKSVYSVQSVAKN